MLGILWIDLLCARSSHGLSALSPVVIVSFIVGVAASSIVGVYQAFEDITWMNPVGWSDLDRAGGMVLDANTLGMGAALWAPVAVLAGWFVHRRPWIAATAFCVLVAGMWASASRTGLLTLVAGTAGLIIAALERRGLWQPRIARLGTLLAVAAVALALAVLPREFESSSPLARALDRLPRLESTDIRRFADELWNRYGYGKAATQMIADHPITGVGIGAFHVVAPDYLYKESGRVVASDNAQNWWRHQVAELGLLGAFPSLWMSWVVVWLLWKGAADKDLTGITTVLRLALIGFGIASLVGVPTQHPATWVSFGTLLFVFATAAGVRPRGTSAAPVRAWWLAAFAVAIATALGQLLTATGELRAPARAAWIGVPYSYGMSTPEGLSELGELRWIRSGAVAVVAVENRWFQLTFWRPEPAAQEPVNVGVTIDGRRLLQQFVQGPDPTTYFIEVPEPRRWAVVEWSVSPSREPHALGVAQQWRRELPADVRPERIIRR
jgi:O-antigen ligase